MLFGAGKVLGFLHGGTDVRANKHQHGAQHKGHAPAPGDKGFVGQEPGEQADHARGQHEAKGKTNLGQAAVKGTLVGRGRFKSHEHRAAPFAAKANALGDTAGHQQNGGPDADAVKGRNAAYQHGGHTHDFKGENEHFFAANLVAKMPEDHCCPAKHPILIG